MFSIRRLGGVTGFLVAWMLAVPARAEDPPPAAPAAPEEPAEAKPETPPGLAPVKAPPPAVLTAAAAPTPRVSVHVYEEEATQARADAVEAAAGQVLAADSRFTYRPFSSLLEPPEDIPRLLGEADLAVMDADKAFGEMDLEKAKTLLKSAIDTYRGNLPQLAERGGGIQPLRDSYIKLAKTRFFDGDNDGAREALRSLFVLDPKATFNKALFPPQMKKTVVEAKLLFETLGDGKLTIDSDPQGAEVWLNGVKQTAKTPLEVEAPAGPNLVSFKLRGYQSITAPFEVEGSAKPSTALQSLARHVNNPLAGINQARLHLDEPTLPSQLKQTVASLGQDLVLLIRFGKHEEPDGAVRTQLTGYLYDARPNRIIKRGERMTSEPEAPEAAKDLTRELTTGIRLDGIYTPPPVPKKPSGWARFNGKMKDDMGRFYHWKGFWYVVGGVAAVIVVGTAVGVGVSVANRHRAVNSLVVFGGGSGFGFGD